VEGQSPEPADAQELAQFATEVSDAARNAVAVSVAVNLGLLPVRIAVVFSQYTATAVQLDVKERLGGRGLVTSR